MNKALLIIDIQNFYFSEYGIEGNTQASLIARKVLNRFREKGLPVFHIQHAKYGENPTEAEKQLVDIHENVRPIAGEEVILKKTPGSFNGTELLKKLREKGVTQLYICGMMTHMCVDTTTREAFDLGFRCTVIHDACATKSVSFMDTEVPAAHVHAATLAALKVFSDVTGSEEVLGKI